MSKRILAYLKFILSLAIMGLGIALVTKANLGVSAISSVPYVLSKVFMLSLGTFTMILNLGYFLVQLIILNKSFPKQQYLQIIVGPVLGFFIDFSMKIFNNLASSVYLIQLAILFLGVIIISFSIWLQIESDVVENPVDGMVKLFAKRLNQDLSTTKTMFDVFWVVLAILISLIGLGKITGIREGTIISAFMVGYVIKLINIMKDKIV